MCLAIRCRKKQREKTSRKATVIENPSRKKSKVGSKNPEISKTSTLLLRLSSDPSVIILCYFYVRWCNYLHILKHVV